MQKIGRIFFQGLITLLPLALTIYIIVAAFKIFENMVGSLLWAVLPQEFYRPGIGLMVAVLLIFLFGLILNNYLAASILAAAEARLLKIPFVRVIYSPLKDVMNLFSKKEQRGLKSVVLVPFQGFRTIGIVTRESFDDLPIKDSAPGQVAVYIPFSYGLGGITVLMPKNQLVEFDIPIEKAMSLAITAWVKADSTPQEEKNVR